MYKIAILGCENSHANAFLRLGKDVSDIEFVGVYSEDTDAAQKLHDEFGVYVMKSADELLGKVDGIIVTARHGDNHYKYAKPYIEYGIPMFIDKPITCKISDAEEMISEFEKYGVKVSGGSMVPLADCVQSLKKEVSEEASGKVIGGFLRAPVNLCNPYGDFYFYSQHLVQTMCEIFGNYPKSVKAYQNDKIITVIVRYEKYDVVCEFTDGMYVYSAHVSFENKILGGAFVLDNCVEREFEEYYNLLKGGEQKQSYRDFIAPVYILNAIDRSLKSGNEETIF